MIIITPECLTPLLAQQKLIFLNFTASLAKNISDYKTMIHYSLVKYFIISPWMFCELLQGHQFQHILNSFIFTINMSMKNPASLACDQLALEHLGLNFVNQLLLSHTLSTAILGMPAIATNSIRKRHMASGLCMTTLKRTV